MIAVLGDEAGHIKLCDEIIEIMAGLQDHITTASAIASIRTALGHICFTSKGYTTTTTVAGLGVYFHLINKHRVIISRPTKKARHEYLAVRIPLFQWLVFYDLHRLDIHTTLAFVFVEFYAARR